MNVTAAQLALGPLQDNGGPTLTHALGTGSVAIDAAVDCPPQVSSSAISWHGTGTCYFHWS